MSKACKVMGYSRRQFYEIRRNFQMYGAEGLLDRLPGPKGPHPNRVPEAIEQDPTGACQYDPEASHTEFLTVPSGSLRRYELREFLTN